MRILIVGNKPSDFLLPLIGQLRTKYGHFIGLLELNLNSAKKDEVVASVDEFVEKKASKKLEFILKGLFSKSFLLFLIKLKEIRVALKCSIYDVIYGRLFESYDVLNFHMLNREVLYLSFVAASRGCKVVLSFWGSDLLNPSSYYPYKEGATAVKNASYITVHSNEMREIFLSKFGREYFDKVIVTLMFDDVSVFKKYTDKLDFKDQIISNYKKRNNIDFSKKLIVIGHSGHEIDNHLLIIDELSKLSQEIKNSIFLIFPMTYGVPNEEYIISLTNKCKESKIEYKILTSYLTNEELIESRFLAEIHIRASKHDAFSLSLCETITTNGLLILGSWLPYSKLRMAGVKYYEVEAYSELNIIVKDLVLNYDLRLEESESNSKAIVEMFSNENVAYKFNKCFVH